MNTATSIPTVSPLPSWLCTTTTTFIPLSTLRPVSSINGAADSVIIHEGLQRWSVRFYLAIMHSVRFGTGIPSDLVVGGDQIKRSEEWKVQVVFPVSLFTFQAKTRPARSLILLYTCFADPTTEITYLARGVLWLAPDHV
jgi:hypothetical protein